MNKKILAVLIVFMFAASGLLAYEYSGVNDHKSAFTSSQAPVEVTGVHWYNQTSSMLPAPGSGDVPLYVTFTALATENVSAFINLTSPFSYSYISGPNSDVKSVYTLSLKAGNSYTIMQMVNISASASGNLYEENITLSTSSGSSNANFTLPIGQPSLSVVTYYTNPPVIYQDQKGIKLTVVTSNTGTSNANNVTAGIYSKYFNVISPANYSIKYYPLGKIMNFTFYLNAKNVSGSAPIYFSMYNITYTLKSRINSDQYVNLKITEASDKLVSGEKKQIITFYINNTGNKTFRDLNIHMLMPSVISIHIPSSNPLAALDADNVTYSSLKPGQSLRVTFIVDVSDVYSGNYPVQLLVEYRFNNTESVFYKTATFTEKVSPSPDEEIEHNIIKPEYLVPIVLVIAILIIIGAAVRHSHKKEKNMNKNNKK